MIHPMPARIPTHRPAHLGPLATHVADRHRRYNVSRRDPVQAMLYGSARWKKFRALIRAQRPLCERCLAEDRTTPTEHVHHKVDPREWPEGFTDPENVEALCESCHNRITGQSRCDTQTPKGG